MYPSKLFLLYSLSFKETRSAGVSMGLRMHSRNDLYYWFICFKKIQHFCI